MQSLKESEPLLIGHIYFSVLALFDISLGNLISEPCLFGLVKSLAFGLCEFSSLWSLWITSLVSITLLSWAFGAWFFTVYETRKTRSSMCCCLLRLVKIRILSFLPKVEWCIQVLRTENVRVVHLFLEGTEKRESRMLLAWVFFWWNFLFSEKVFHTLLLDWSLGTYFVSWLSDRGWSRVLAKMRFIYLFFCLLLSKTCFVERLAQHEIIVKLSLSWKALMVSINGCRSLPWQTRQRSLSSFGDGLRFLLETDLLSKGISFNSAVISTIFSTFLKLFWGIFFVLAVIASLYNYACLTIAAFNERLGKVSVSTSFWAPYVRGNESSSKWRVVLSCLGVLRLFYHWHKREVRI